MVLALTPEQFKIEYDRRLVKQYGLLAFGTLAWPLVEPAYPYEHNWHTEEVCKHVESAYFGECSKMLITVPPSTGKSIWCSVMAPVWAWTVDPTYRVGVWSYSESLIQRDAGKCLTILQSRWFQDRWPSVQLKRKNPKVHEIWNTAGGLRFCSTVHGQGTGWHLNLVEFDDTLKASEAMGSALTTKAELDFVNNVWWDGTMGTRVQDPKEGLRYLGIMQRLHENDLVGHIKRTDKPVHLRLPMRFEERDRCITPLGGDRRTQEGALLWPGRYPETTVQDLERRLGIHARAQLQQDPTDPEGNMFKAEKLRRWHELPRLSSLILSGDMSFKKSVGSDNCAWQVWGSDGTRFYLVDQIVGRMSFEDAVRAARVLCAKHSLDAKLVEDTANGPAVIEVLKEALSGVIPVKPEGGKVARANSVLWLFDAGDVYFPEDDSAPWVPLFVAEVLAFPRGLHDDQVDAMTQALGYLSKNSGSMWAFLEREVKEEAERRAAEWTPGFGNNPFDD